MMQKISPRSTENVASATPTIQSNCSRISFLVSPSDRAAAMASSKRWPKTFQTAWHSMTASVMTLPAPEQFLAPLRHDNVADCRHQSVGNLRVRNGFAGSSTHGRSSDSCVAGIPRYFVALCYVAQPVVATGLRATRWSGRGASGRGPCRPLHANTAYGSRSRRAAAPPGAAAASAAASWPAGVGRGGRSSRARRSSAPGAA